MKKFAEKYAVAEKITDDVFSCPFDPRPCLKATGTAIDEIESGSIDDDCYSEIYSIAGIRLQSLQKGINIVKTADGKLKKVLR